MGMFDKETQLKNAEFVGDSIPTAAFDLWTAEYRGKVRSADFGENDKAVVTAGPNREEFVVFGVMAQQIQRMDDGDLPASVRIVKDGRANILEAVGPTGAQPENTQEDIPF